MFFERLFQKLFRREKDSMHSTEQTGLTEMQKGILEILVAESARRGADGSFTYQSEWLGYLPFGQYCWVKIGEESISKLFPSGWEESDLDALVAAGFAVKLGESTPVGGQGDDRDVFYRLQGAESQSVSQDEREKP